MNLYRMPLGALGTNCYIVVDESNQHCLVVDPGGEGERLVALLKEKGLQPEAVILTHGHGDHIGGVQAVVDAFKVPVYINKGDEEFLTNSNLNLSGAIGQPVKVTGDIHFIKEDDVIHLGEYSFKIIETPGIRRAVFASTVKAWFWQGTASFWNPSAVPISRGAATKI